MIIHVLFFLNIFTKCLLDVKKLIPNLQEFKNNQIKLDNIIVLSDVNGRLYGLKKDNGEVLWESKEFESYISINKIQNNKDSFLIIEPYKKGKIFYFQKNYGLHLIVPSIHDMIIQTPYTSADGNELFIGRKESKNYEIDLYTGKFHFETKTDQIELNNLFSSTKNVFCIKKTTYEFFVFSKKKDIFSWNFTYQNWDTCEYNFNYKTNVKSDFFLSPIYNNTLFSININNSSINWKQKFDTIINDIFEIVLFNDSIKLLQRHENDEFLDFYTSKKKFNSIHKKNFVYIDKSRQLDFWFAYSWSTYPLLIESAPFSYYQKKFNHIYKNLIQENKPPLEFEMNQNDLFLIGVNRYYISNYNFFTKRIFLEDKKVSLYQTKQLKNIKNLNKKLKKKIKFNQFFSDLYGLIEFLNQNHYINFFDPFLIDYFNYLFFNKKSSFSFLSKRIFEDLIIVFTILIIIFFANFVKSYLKKPQIKTLVLFKNQIQQIIKGIFKKKFNASDLDVLKNDVSSVDSKLSMSADKNFDTIKVSSNSIDLNCYDSVNKISEDSIKSNNLILDKTTNSEKIVTKSQNKKTFSEDDSDSQNIKEKKKLDSFLNESEFSISDDVLGYGSNGTIVYRGMFAGKHVAVKRVLMTFYNSANYEIKLLKENDDHPNVIRYFCSKTSKDNNFLYIVTELCICTLNEIIENPKKKLRLDPNQNKDHLYQLASGLHYLHSLKIVHRDLKPQNILIGHGIKSKFQNSRNSFFSDDKTNNNLRLIISDFGLCKKLENENLSFLDSKNTNLGSVGWRSPELLYSLNFHKNIDYFVEDDNLKFTNFKDDEKQRLTMALDIFSMGCIFFYILTKGGHPFGSIITREKNIFEGNYSLSLLKKYVNEDIYESIDLISTMIGHNNEKRLTSIEVIKHPFFWLIEAKIDLLLRLSDWIDHKDKYHSSKIMKKFEENAFIIHHGDWQIKIDDDVLTFLTNYRKYYPTKLSDLLRSFRNIYHHINQMNSELKKKFFPFPKNLFNYYLNRFPLLFIEIYHFVSSNLSNDAEFTKYF